MRTILRLVLAAVSLLVVVFLVAVIISEYSAARRAREELRDRKQWFYDRGQQARDWKECVRLGVTLRQACGQDAACADESTRLFTSECYAGRYRAAKGSEIAGPPFAFQAANQLSGSTEEGVRYRQPGEPGYLSPADFARALCKSQLPELPAPACAQEVSFAVEKLDGWGAGP